jgi:chromosome segregation ATPase
MQTKTSTVNEAERLLPLIRVIRREIRERTLAATDLEQRLEALAPTRKAHAAEITAVESELSGHRRELRRIERELRELGCKQDSDRPLRILLPSDDGELAVDGELSKTAIRRIPLQPNR